ncbi:MAG: type I DNA topoisomerase [Rickettsiales bacterium]|nr:type I DNA topoisomerase [Rickettsiales bacterium]
MDLVIVESPAKAKTINKYLGKDFKVVSSFGHIRDLPSKNGSVLPEENFKMIYDINKGSNKHVTDIVSSAKNAKNIYLASDPDREGEAIAWHVVEILKSKKGLNKDTKFQRISFHEITKKAVTDAIKQPRDINMDLVNAQQARRALDYLVGFNLSPILWRKLPGSRSAGRVQSVALRLICDREEEIEKFISQEYWTITCEFQKDKHKFEATIHQIDGKKIEKFSFPNKEEADKIVALLDNKQYHVSSIEKKQQSRNPFPPFMTSTLQQDASNKLGFSAKKTMQIAQKLYEGININGENKALITYMRTDSINLSKDAISSLRSFIAENFSDKYLPKTERTYQKKVKNAQEAHEAIRPIDVTVTPKDIENFIEKDFLKLYDLIWKRTVASQMESAIFDQVNVFIDSEGLKATLKAAGSTLAFDGYQKVYNENLTDKKEEKKNVIPPLKEKDALDLNQILPEQHFTEPPARYSEASLVKKLEELGIGRPSTYASIISVLQDREYVVLQNKKFIPEERGRWVTAFLVSFFNKYVEYDFTATLEDDLDEVSHGKINWKDLLENFWKPFEANVNEVSKYKYETVIEKMEHILDSHIFKYNKDSANPKECPHCKTGKLSLRIGKYGPYISCSRYPDCQYTHKLGIEASEEISDEVDGFSPKILGKNESNDKDIHLKKGPYGIYVQLGEDQDKDKKRMTIPKNIHIDDVDLKFAQTLLSFPKEIGTNPENNKPITAAIGKFGPYISCNGKNSSIDGGVTALFKLSLEEAIRILNKKDNNTLGQYKDKDIAVKQGKFGPYIKYDNQNIKIPRTVDSANLTLEEATKLVENHLKK